MLVIISSPSGGGKDSIINALVKRLPNSARLITTTTRDPRVGEKDGVNYYFVTVPEFKKRLAAEAFMEHNFYAGHYYGSEKKHLEEMLKKYTVVFTQIEVNGKHHLDRLGIPHLSIFLIPENLEMLRTRIEKRGDIDQEMIDERLKTAAKEIAASNDYDYRLVNEEGKMGQTIEKILKIITNQLHNQASVDPA